MRSSITWDSNRLGVIEITSETRVSLTLRARQKHSGEKTGTNVQESNAWATGFLFSPCP